MGPGFPVKISLYWITPSQMATDLDSLNLNCPYLQQTSKMIIQVSIFRNINFPMYTDCPCSKLKPRLHSTYTAQQKYVIYHISSF